MHVAASLDQPFQWVQVEFKCFTIRKSQGTNGGCPSTMGHISLIFVAGDTDKIVPKNTYGMTKACGELFVNDCTRKEGRGGLVLSEAS